MKITWCERNEYIPKVLERLERVESILDIGCGIMPQKYIRPSVHICCEPFVQYVDILKKKIRSEYDRSYVILHASWSDAVNMFPSRSVDSVFLIDVIEHIEKEDGLRLLGATESIARRQVVLFTPLGFFPQKHVDGRDAWGLCGAAWQEHRSGWLPEDFDDSWEIIACRDFHTTNNLGEALEIPFGAMWAIKTMEKSDHDGQISYLKKRNIFHIVNVFLDIKESVLRILVKPIRFMKNIV